MRGGGGGYVTMGAAYFPAHFPAYFTNVGWG